MEPSLDPPDEYWDDILEDEDLDIHDDPEPTERDIQEAENRWQKHIDERW